ncbi:hypothetical protein [Aquabacterium sp. OR-4]|uniref:hypothetical protein n=1 Tax=Aquabacterium sp. OR-4 TaxID=2978127 RepID=UPI0021B19CBF|nr:hypothetical protein [Aquabacterium sp. OR-4]MDT7836161.1 hypothetical protein [Aquabacterium sp. OR-4]
MLPALPALPALLASIWLAATPARLAAAERPILPTKAGSAAGFVPAGWQIAQQAAPDLNRDGRADAVLLLQPDAPPAAPGTGRSPERLLLVLLQQRDGWALLQHNDQLVPQVDLATQEDPLINGELLAGKAGSFSLSLGFASSAGSYSSAMQTYRFRLDGRCVRLIGHDQLQTHRGTLDTRDTSINFLTGAVLHTLGNAQTDASTRQRARLASNPRRCLADLGSALAFEPLGPGR